MLRNILTLYQIKITLIYRTNATKKERRNKIYCTEDRDTANTPNPSNISTIGIDQCSASLFKYSTFL